MSSHIIALATYLGPERNAFGAAIEPTYDEVGMAIKIAREVSATIASSSRQYDAVIFATTGIRQIFPSGSAAIVEALGLDCKSFDILTGCASLSIGIEMGARMSGTVLVVCADLLSRTIDPQDPSHFPLQTFADGAAALVIENNSDLNQGIRIIAQYGKTVGKWHSFYQSKNGKIQRSLPVEAKRDLSDAYIRSWREISLNLLSHCPAGTIPWIYANQGDAKLFPQLMESLGFPLDHLIRTSHGHAGSADPWVGLQTQPPPLGSYAILLASGIGFSFHGTLVQISNQVPKQI